MTNESQIGKALTELLAEDPASAMEAAKNLIGMYKQVQPDALVQILGDRQYRTWSRIAAAYVLGFLEYTPHDRSIKALIRVVNDVHEPIALRSHAAEALGNLGAVEAIRMLERVAERNESPELRRWCNFALSEIRPEDR